MPRRASVDTRIREEVRSELFKRRYVRNDEKYGKNGADLEGQIFVGE